MYLSGIKEVHWLKTLRLQIRPVEPSDSPKIHEILQDEETMRYFVEGPYNFDQTMEIIRKDQPLGYHLAVLLKDSNELIGKITFNPWFADRTYEIGWIFNKRFINEGYCFEASQAIIHFGFTEMNLHRIVATCQPENSASKRICEKLGMRLEGIFKKCIYYKEGIWWDELFYAILKEENE